jgi:hypothetical protein
MSAGQLSVPIVFRGPNGAAAGVGAQHSQVSLSLSLSVNNIFVLVHDHNWLRQKMIFISKTHLTGSYSVPVLFQNLSDWILSPFCLFYLFF